MDGRTTKKLITHLKPNTFYNFVLTNRGSSLGGLQQTVTAWTAFNLLSGKPSVAPKPDTNGFIMVYLPDGQSPVPVQYAQYPLPPGFLIPLISQLCDWGQPLHLFVLSFLTCLNLGITSAPCYVAAPNVQCFSWAL